MANLTVTIQEDITLNGSNQGLTTTKIYPDIEHIYGNGGILPLGTAAVLYTTATSSWYGNTIDVESIKFMRISNYSTQYTALFQGNHPGIGGGAVYRNITGIKATAQGSNTLYQLRAYGTATGSA